MEVVEIALYSVGLLLLYWIAWSLYAVYDLLRITPGQAGEHLPEPRRDAAFVAEMGRIPGRAGRGRAEGVCELRRYDDKPPPEIRTCKTDGCDVLLDWLKSDGSRTGARYCKPCVKKRSSTRWVEDRKWQAVNRVGVRLAHTRDNRPPCDVCFHRLARIGFSFCMKCSVCRVCGKNKPRSKYSTCADCYKRKLRRRIARYHAQGGKQWHREYGQRNKNRLNQYRRNRYANDPEFRRKRLDSSKKRSKEKRLSEKSPRPCLECGSVIPIEAPSHKKYCCERCQKKAASVRYLAKKRAERFDRIGA